MTDDPTNATVQGKPCWCVSSCDQYTAFCPHQVDTCRIEEGFRVMNSSGSSWLVPFAGQFVFQMYSALLLSSCFSRQGSECRDSSSLINVVSCCGQSQARYAQWMERILCHNNRRFWGWIRHLLETGFARERDQVPDPCMQSCMQPSTLYLKTRT